MCDPHLERDLVVVHRGLLNKVDWDMDEPPKSWETEVHDFCDALRASINSSDDPSERDKFDAYLKFWQSWLRIQSDRNGRGQGIDAMIDAVRRTMREIDPVIPSATS